MLDNKKLALPGETLKIDSGEADILIWSLSSLRKNIAISFVTSLSGDDEKIKNSAKQVKKDVLLIDNLLNKLGYY